MDAACNVAGDRAHVKAMYERMLEHQREWSADRAAALAIRRALEQSDPSAIYECDDKCGSWWQSLPVDPTGRNGKSVVADLYHFSIQANVVCGTGGLIRFGLLPKHVATGGNFGLTNFLMVLLRSFDRGRLGPHVKTVYRHTDGGSDNVSIVTHVMHWLLVYLGVADEIIWFRFESG
jgi:hypothetical protein